MKNRTFSKRFVVIRAIVLCSIFFLLLASFIGVTASAQTDIELAQQYAPILYFEAEETCYPVDVEYHISNSYLYQIGSDTPVDTSPISTGLSAYGENYYLDNQKVTVEDEGIINDYQSQVGTYGYTVYARVYTDSGYTVIQYWMFYAFNKGELNQHEGDWEMVQVVLSGETPTSVMYSQHHGGQTATWAQVEKEGNHIKVYVARGSHANYLRSYSGKLGIASDYVGANGQVLEFGDYSLELLNLQSWLNFEGRWGWVGGDGASAVESSVLGAAGPPGPMFREEGEMWDSSVAWGDSLSPADDTFFMLEWLLYNFITIFIVVTAALLALAIFRIYRRHKKTGLGPRIVSIFYIDGLNLKSVGNILAIVGIILAVLALFYPWYTMSYGLTGSTLEGYETAGMVDLLKVDGLDGIQMTIPGSSGPVPLGTFSIPFSLFIGIGIMFMIIACVGIIHSKKLGGKYLWRGLKLMIPIIILIIIIMAIGGMVPTQTGVEEGTDTMASIFSDISGNPLGGQTTKAIADTGASLSLQWGLGLGAQLFLISGIILIIAGAFEMIANIEFFKPKISAGSGFYDDDTKYGKKLKNKKTAAVAKPKSAVKFCTECGKDIPGDSEFCTECGKKNK